jgi:hypothetical protein
MDGISQTLKDPLSISWRPALTGLSMSQGIGGRTVMVHSLEHPSQAKLWSFQAEEFVNRNVNEFPTFRGSKIIVH